MKKNRRAVIIVLDGLGAGAQADAAKYGDAGTNTLKHVYETCHPDLPNMEDLGLKYTIGLNGPDDDEPLGCYGTMIEKAAGKDTTTGHWELAGLTLDKPFPTYPDGFPQEVIDAFKEETGMDVIGNCAASGTEIINRLGDKHLRTGSLIVYTSADSVFQIAAHEGIVPVMELWHICRVARNKVLTGKHAVGRVIARPFVGEKGVYTRTDNRRDFSVDPFGDTLLDVVKREGMDSIGVGKIEDIFNHKGLTKSVHSAGNAACIDTTVEFLKKGFNGLMFVNLVDTDMLYGHRRDPEGYAKCLEEFDRRLPEIQRLLGDDGMLILTADHGCDPTFKAGTDHTREQVPLLVWGLGLQEGVNLGTRNTFADVSQTVLEWLGIKPQLDGTSFLKDIEL